MKAYKVTINESGYKYNVLFMNGKFYGSPYISSRYSHIDSIDALKSEEMKNIASNITEVYVNQELVDFMDKNLSDSKKYTELMEKAAGKKKLNDMDCYDNIRLSLHTANNYIITNLEP